MKAGFGTIFGNVLAMGLVLAAHGLARAETPQGVALVKADRVVVDKSERRLSLMRNGKVIRSFRVALGRNPVGTKRREGDGRTPEGRYVLDWRNNQSRFYRSIHISYPSADDRRRAQAAGVSPGGAIMIHGLPNGRGAIGAEHARWDWTDGCIAVTNAEMDEIWARIDNGVAIEIKP
jgi:murein L,D-transpeptidase YafK